MKVLLLLSSVLLAVHLASSEPIGICPSVNGADDVHLPDTEYCGIFYHCDWGTPVLKVCAANLVFNTATNQCDYAENVNCIRVPGGEAPEEEIAGGPVAECPAEDPYYGTYIPDKQSCSLYYVCSNGNPIQMKCSEGLHFDGVAATCNYPGEVTCGLYQPGGNGGDGGNGGETPEVEVPESGPISACPEGNGEYDILLPDKDNCAIYYQCNWGVAVLVECPANLVFNAAENVCDYPENVNCQRATNGTDNGNGTDAGGPGGPGNGTDAGGPGGPGNGTDAGGPGGPGNGTDAGGPGEPGNGTGPGNSTEGGIVGSGPIGVCPEENGEFDVLLPDGENCAIYYQCDWGVAVPRACSEDTYFNVETGLCDYADQVNCDRASNGTGPGNGTDGGGPVEGGPGNSTDGGGPIEGGPGNSTDGGGNSTGPIGGGPLVACPADDPYYGTYIPDRDNCAIYYVCEAGKPILMECPAGLHYDGELWGCNFPDLVTCGVYKPGEGGDSAPTPDEEASGPIYACPAENGAQDVLIPDIDNCRVYYQCDWGVPVYKLCSADLYFNAVLMVCDYLENVDCDRYSQGNGEGGANEGGSEETVPLEVCPENADPSVYYISQHNPQKFYACVGDIPMVQTCPAKLIFSAQHQMCVYA